MPGLHEPTHVPRVNAATRNRMHPGLIPAPEGPGARTFSVLRRIPSASVDAPRHTLDAPNHRQRERVVGATQNSDAARQASNGRPADAEASGRPAQLPERFSKTSSSKRKVLDGPYSIYFQRGQTAQSASPGRAGLACSIVGPIKSSPRIGTVLEREATLYV
jgi:hypothetical protein